MKSKVKKKTPEKLYKDFHWKENYETKNDVIDIPDKWIFIGKATEINYQSDKFDGKARHYRHKLKSFGNILISPNGKTILITDLKLQIKKEGLTG